MYLLKKILVVVLFLIMAIDSSIAKDVIYISSRGADNNNGSKRHPLRTLEAGFERVKNLREKGEDGELELRLLEGTYYLSNTLNLNNNAYSNVSVVGDGINKTIVSGGVRLNGCLSTRAGIICCKIEDFKTDDEAPQLYVNDRRMTLARTPNANHYYHPMEYSWKAINEKGGMSGIIDFILPSEAKKRLNTVVKKNNVIVSFLHEWCETRRFIKHYDAKQGLISMVDPINRSRQYFRRNGAKQFFLENDYSFMDVEGEYFFDNEKRTFYFIPYKNDRTITEIMVPVNNMLLKITGEREKPISNICFRDISFKSTSYKMPEGGEEPFQASSEASAAIILDYVKGIEFKNCEFCHTGEFALWFRKGCHHSSIVHCYLHDLGGGGIKIGVSNSPLSADKDYEITHHVRVDNNIVREGGRILNASAGILLMQASDCIISNNDISDFFYTGISVGWTWGYDESPAKRNIICNNHIHHLGWGALDDMGGVYTLGNSSGTVIKNNIIHHLYSMGDKAWGIYLDEGSSGIVVSGNVVYDCKTSSFHLHYGRNNYIENNIFISKGTFEISKLEKHKSLTFEHNVITLEDSLCSFFKDSWSSSNVECVNNLFWSTSNDSLFVNDLPVGNLFEDPRLAVDKKGFHNVNNRVALKIINFKSLKLSKVGVYGRSSWKRLAMYNKENSSLFDNIVNSSK